MSPKTLLCLSHPSCPVSQHQSQPQQKTRNTYSRYDTQQVNIFNSITELLQTGQAHQQSKGHQQAAKEETQSLGVKMLNELESKDAAGACCCRPHPPVLAQDPDQRHLPLLVAAEWTQKFLETILSVGNKSLRGPVFVNPIIPPLRVYSRE